MQIPQEIVGRSSCIGLLNAVHHQGLRLALGTFRTSPVQSLYIEANKLSLNNRRNKLAMQYVVKLKTIESCVQLYF